MPRKQATGPQVFSHLVHPSKNRTTVIRTYAVFLKASNSSVTVRKVKAYCPLPFIEMEFPCFPPVLNSAAQFSLCLLYCVQRKIFSMHNMILKDSDLLYEDFSIGLSFFCLFGWLVCFSSLHTHLYIPLFLWVSFLLVPTGPYLCLRLIFFSLAPLHSTFYP